MDDASSLAPCLSLFFESAWPVPVRAKWHTQVVGPRSVTRSSVTAPPELADDPGWQVVPGFLRQNEPR